MKATHWKKIPANNDSKVFHYVPCDPKTREAVEKKLMDIEPSMIKPPPVTEVYFSAAFSC